ncbi:FAD-dependent oxidoreductase [Bacillus sp. LBG-1-113]|uniref:FAD-dependent oxidoreductase n=1 Tax=Bacillus sp. LBG-1-113 TaxID=2886094 RepID=UPI001E501F9D|nr:FAD-dependent monooxygenase [Bacillus sp. LBG-1-113]MCC2931618.1 FAD-dependent monooxygenase [Bacillus sp. LBG-1-113]
MSEKHVLIIGGGIAGVAMGIFLKKQGISCSVYEGYPIKKDAGAAFGIFPNGMNVLESLGLKQEVLKNSWSIKVYETINMYGTVMSTFTLVDEENHYYPMQYIARSKLMNILLETAQNEGVCIHYGKKLINLHQDETSVTAYFEDGTQETGTELVGADGIHSKTRQNIFNQCSMFYAGYSIIQGIVSSQDLCGKNYESFASYVKGNNIMGIARCHSGDIENYHWVCSVYSDRKISSKELEQKTTEELKIELLKLFKDWSEPIPSMIENSRQIHARSRFEFKPLESWSKNRVVLIGDALHGISPDTGQGVSLALEDAMYLSKLMSEHDYKDAYHYFEFDRKARVQNIRKMAEMENPMLLGFDIFKNPTNVAASTISAILERKETVNE